jgi:micrococcal nuclease
MTTWTCPATVLRIVDADTLRLAIDAGFKITYTADIRVGHCNAPELRTPEGQAARDFVLTLLTIGDAVTFASRRLDKYGRPLGDVTLADGRDLGKLLIDNGHAVAYEGGAR